MTLRVKINLLIFFFLVFGVIFRLVLTSNNNFIFNIDNARDQVDIREMVVLGKARLIGNTAAIEGVYYGPFWYYLSSIPFFLSGGNPYTQILMMITLWAIGGYFILTLAKRYGLISLITVGTIWVASNVVTLATTYAFNPNPVLFLTPLFLFLFDRYLTTKNTLFSVLFFAIAASFFSFEILFAILLPLIIVLTILFCDKKIFKLSNFWIGVGTFLVLISPQILFDFKHQFLMTHSLINYFSQGTGGESISLPERILLVFQSFYQVLLPTFMNFKFFTVGIIMLALIVIFRFIKTYQIKKDNLLLLILFYIFIPVIGFILIPTTINSWHWVGVISACILFSGIVLSKIEEIKFFGKAVSLIFLISLTLFALFNIKNYYLSSKIPSRDTANFKVEFDAVDYVYSQANGKNFKVYAYLPSVIDYPYQYLFWWRGLNKYGYVPKDYAYEPNKPEYIKQKDKLNTGTNPPDSELIFLIKEPDRIGRRHLWENDFKIYKTVSREMVGPLEIEIKKAN